MGLERPKKKLKRVAKRHFWSSAATKSWAAKSDNSILLPGTPWQEDIEEINEGLAISAKDRNGAQIFVIDGRVYGVHDTTNSKEWTPFPIQGDGIALSSRKTYKAVASILKCSNISEAIRALRFKKVEKDVAESAWRIWEAIQRGKQK